MKTNKKAIMGFVIAMIFSLAIIQGLSSKSVKQDVSMQQGTFMCGYYASSGSEFGPAMSATWGIMGAFMLETTSAIALPCVAAGPVGWAVLGAYAL